MQKKDGKTKAVLMISDVLGNDFDSIEEMKQTPLPLVYLMAGSSYPQIKDAQLQDVEEKIQALEKTHVHLAKNFLELGKKCRSEVLS